MLIVYRTNTGHEGEVAYLDKTSSALECDEFLKREAEAGRTELDYIEINEALMAPKQLAKLCANPTEYKVRKKVLKAKNGDAVDLGYDPATEAANPMASLAKLKAKVELSEGAKPTP